MTNTLIADSIIACEINIPEEKKEAPKKYQAELRAKDTNVFQALFLRLSQLSDHISVSFTHAGIEGCPLEAGGVAIFYYSNEESAKKLSRNMDIIKESIQSTIITGLIDVPEPLQAIMDADELGGAYVDRILSVKAALNDSAEKRAKEIADRKCADKDEFDAAVNHNLALLSDDAYTLEDEVKAIIATIMASFDGIKDQESLASVIKLVGKDIDGHYRKNRIIEEHVDLYTSSALERIIDEIGEQDSENEMAAYRIHKEARDLLENNKRSTVIRELWQACKGSLGMALNAIYPNAKRKEDAAPVMFTGIDTSCTLSPSFAHRLALGNFKRTVSEHEPHQMGALASAIVAQLGSFIEMKRGHTLKAKRHQLAKGLIDQYKEQGKLSIMGIANRVLEDTKSVF